MLDTQIYLKQDGITAFMCPECKMADTTYGGMPPVCWNCGYIHQADPDILVGSQRDRLFYHRFARTPVNTTKEEKEYATGQSLP